MHTKVLYTFYGIILSAITTPVAFALTSVESDFVMQDQKAALKFTGSYQPVYDQLVNVYTYEGICKGYYTVEDNGVDVVYTGFGDLANQYTFKTPSNRKISDTKPTTTKDADIDLSVDTSTENIIETIN